MKTGVMSYAEANDLRGEIAFANKEAYCRHKGYRFLGINQMIDPDLPAGWQKVLLCLQYLDEFDWLLWTDCNVLIMNQAQSLEAIPQEGSDLLIASDYKGVNSGVFLIKNSVWSKRFLKRLLANPYSHGWSYSEEGQELDAFRNLISGEYADDLRIHVCEQSVLNPYPQAKAYQSEAGTAPLGFYNEGDFCVHFQGQIGEALGIDAFREFAGQAREFTPNVLPQYDVRTLTENNALASADRYTGRIEPYPDGRYEGRGITICGGGVRYFTCAWVCIRMLRKLGCELPIELWYLGDQEMDARMKSLIEPYGVECRDGLEERRNHPSRRLDGWELKPFSIIHSRFSEVLLLDADNVPVVDPAYLFETPQYRQTGAVFWPDYGRLAPERQAWSVFGVAYQDEPEFETGQILINKEKCWEPLQLTMFYNENSDFYYKHVHGDKDTFHMAFRRLNADYSMPERPIQNLEDTPNLVMCQHDFDGNRIFQHRSQSKWVLHGRNRPIEGFEYTDECRAFIARLKALWNGEIRPDASPVMEGMNVKVIEELVGTKLTYRRTGLDQRPIELLPDGRIGEGVSETIKSWAITPQNGSTVLVLASDRETTCRLHRDEDGVWRGHWLADENILVEIFSQ